MFNKVQMLALLVVHVKQMFHHFILLIVLLPLCKLYKSMRTNGWSIVRHIHKMRFKVNPQHGFRVYVPYYSTADNAQFLFGQFGFLGDIAA
jgi:hypothetical protein